MSLGVDLKAQCQRCGEDVTPRISKSDAGDLEALSKALDQAMQDHVCDSRKAEQHGS